MSLITSIYKLPVEREVNESEGSCTVAITYNKKIFYGHAILHPDDKDFFSKKVGCTIATSRARANILHYLIRESKEELRIRELFYRQALAYRIENPDPTNAFKRLLKSSQRRVYNLKQALKQEHKWLKEYLEGQEKAILSIKNHRNKDNTN